MTARISTSTLHHHPARSQRHQDRSFMRHGPDTELHLRRSPCAIGRHITVADRALSVAEGSNA
jgi:hypothetical protein